MSNTPTRIQLSRKKGWRMPENTLKVDQTTQWGNPFRIDEPPSQKLLNLWTWKLRHWDEPCGDAKTATNRFYGCLANDPPSLALVRRELKGKNLACWCPLVDEHGEPVPCHAIALLKIANEEAACVKITT